MDICTTCHRVIKPGQRVIQNYVVQEQEPREIPNLHLLLDDINYQHSNCYDADGPRYDAEGNEIAEPKGYVHPKHR